MRTTFDLEAQRVLANLRTAASAARELTSTQRANAVKEKWDRVNKELKDKLTDLAKEVEEALEALEALKQFKMSTAASRENLRNSRQNLDQMEEQARISPPAKMNYTWWGNC